MSPLAIVGIAAASVLAVTFIVLLLRVKIRFTCGSNCAAVLDVSLPFFTFHILKAEKSNNAHNKEKRDKKKNRKGIPFSDVLVIVKLCINRLKWILRKIHLHKISLAVMVANEDAAEAALTYGGICATLYPLLAVISSSMRTDNDAVSTEIRCDFDGGKSEYSVSLCASVRVVFALYAALYVIINYGKQSVE